MKTSRHPIALLLLFAVACSPVSGSDRETTVIDAITDRNADISDRDREAKYCKMAASPFMFYRGTNHLFWMDLAGDDRLQKFGNDKTKAWIQGDLHTDNFGSFNTGKGEIIYNLNDFDEASLADYQYDVWRLAVSLVLVARQNDLSSEDEKAIVDGFSESYLGSLDGYRENDNETKTEFTKANTNPRLSELLEKVEEKRTRETLLNLFTEKTGEGRRFTLERDRLEALTLQERGQFQRAIENYGKTLSGDLQYNPQHFQIKDVARRVLAGTGSLGTSRYYVLIEGETKSDDDDRLLDVKQQSKPTPYDYLSEGDREQYDRLFENDAQRHQIGYLALLGTVDNYLGWMQLSDGFYSVREMSPYKDDISTDKLNKTDETIEMAKQWGQILATDHARSDRDFDPQYIPHSLEAEVGELTDGNQEEFRQLVRSIATEYGDRVESDWEIFTATLKPSDCQ